MSLIVAIVGPTAIGKSCLAVELAVAFNGEIVSADSRQIYKYMDIGTAKSDMEQGGVPHYLVDIINPDQGSSLAQFQQMAGEAIYDIQRRGKLPFVVGGSGQYVWALLEGWEVPKVAPDRELRQRLEERAAAGEGEELYSELVAREPGYASRIDSRNVRRVIRALEVSQTRPGSPGRQRNQSQYEELIIGLTAGREEVYRRIDRRVDEMIEGGLVDEVKDLVSRGYDYSLPSMSAIGYRQIAAYLRSEISLNEAVQQIKYESHRFVRQQYNWFKLEDKRIKWFNIEDTGTPAVIHALVEGFIGKNEN